MFRLFSKYLLIGLSAFLLMVAAQQGLFSNSSAKLALANPPVQGPPVQGPPVQGPPVEESPQCNESPDHYGQCGGTCDGVTYASDEEIDVTKNVDFSTCSVSWVCVNKGKSAVCGYNPAPPAQPAPPVQQPPVQQPGGPAKINNCTVSIGESTCQNGKIWFCKKEGPECNGGNCMVNTGQVCGQQEDEEDEEQGNAGLCQSCSRDEDCAAPAGESRGFCCTGDSCGAVKNRCTVRNWTVNDCSAPAPVQPPVQPVAPVQQQPAVGGNVTQTTGNVTQTTGNVTQTQNANPVITITNPASAPQVVLAGQPAVAGVTVTQLPKTGLPVLAWAAAAFIPAGFRMRKFSKVEADLEDNPSFIWETRKFKSALDS